MAYKTTYTIKSGDNSLSFAYDSKGKVLTVLDASIRERATRHIIYRKLQGHLAWFGARKIKCSEQFPLFFAKELDECFGLTD